MEFPLQRRVLLALRGSVIGIFIGALLCLAADARADRLVRTHTENRFLFVVNTSSAMKPLSIATQKAIVGLLRSSMQGQLRDGDTFGLWTYNDKVAKDFPMQVWSEQDKDYIIQRVAAYLSQQQYEKRAHLEKVFPYLQTVIQNSPTLTIVFAFDGTEPMKGTPFDKDINDLHKEYSHELRASNLPFVTILAARDGEIFDYTVNSPTSIIVPHTVEPAKPPETNAAPVAVVAPASAPPPPPKPEPRKIEIVLSGAPSAATPRPAPVPQVTAPAPSPAPVLIVQSAPAPQAVTVVPVPQPAAVVPAPQPTPQPVVQITTPAPTPASAPQPVIVVATPTPALPAAPVIQSEPPKVVPAPQRVVPIVQQPAPAPSPAPVVSEKVQSSPPPPAPVTQPRTEPLAAPATQTSVAGPTASDHIALFVIALSLLTIAILLVFFLLRRARGGPQPSLISQSINHPHNTGR